VQQLTRCGASFRNRHLRPQPLSQDLDGRRPGGAGRRAPRSAECRLQTIDRELGLYDGAESRLLKYARRLGLLTVRDELPPQLARDTRPGAQLGRLFYPAQVVVIEAPEPTSPALRARLERQHEADDLLHEMLGTAAAERLAPALKHDDIVALAAGRAVFHTARALANMPGTHKKKVGIPVIALHGRPTAGSGDRPAATPSSRSTPCACSTRSPRGYPWRRCRFSPPRDR
jgi:hypothetical protein